MSDHDATKAQHPYQSLTPDVVLDALEACGFEADGRLLALNSYENRVYQIGTFDGFVIGKFYRPERWSDAAILEEHAFAAELAAREIPVVAPLADAAGNTLHRHADFRFALFPRRGGRWPPLDDPDTLLRLGRFLGRLHAVGAARPFEHRPALEVEGYAGAALTYLLEHDFLPPALREEYRRWAEQVLGQCREAFARAGGIATLRLHGDCHPGNILWTETGGHFVDLDDCRSGPAIQDLWMLLSGERPQMVAQLSELIEGYEEFHDFDRRELALIEPLRAMRMLYYSGWLARRWDDPAFPMNFPWFGSERYWEEQLLALREQSQRLEEAPLKLF